LTDERENANIRRPILLERRNTVGKIVLCLIASLISGFGIVAVSILAGYIMAYASTTGADADSLVVLQALLMGIATYLIIVWLIQWLHGERMRLPYPVLTLIGGPLGVMAATLWSFIPIEIGLTALALIAAFAVFRALRGGTASRGRVTA
jgi:hypothetical protein